LEKPKNKVLCPELPVLSDYSKPPQAEYWDNFPKNPVPVKPVSDISASKLAQKVKDRSEMLTDAEKFRAETCIKNLTLGAGSFQRFPLPACYQQNSTDVAKYGKEVADAIASWVKKGFAAGPFDYPPLRNFRVNPLLAIQQNGKVRPVLNLSEPKGASFNENVLTEKLEKVNMTSCKQFSKSLYEAGKGAKFSKYDFVDAYKNVPVQIKDLNLQGFSWQNKYFLETRQIFGAKTAVQNFDILANTLVSVTNAVTKIPKKFVHRTLDDVPVIAPKCESWNEDFDKEFEELCSELNVKLAPECVKLEKAFKNSPSGKVLGMFFDGNRSEWKTPEEKRKKYLNYIREVLAKKMVDLKSMQALMGILNHAGQLSPFISGFRHNLNKCLGYLQTHPSEEISLSKNVLDELRIWTNFMEDEEWHPLCGAYVSPPLASIELVSDAAGCKEGDYHRGKLGCGNVGFNHNGEIIFAHQLFWPSDVIRSHKDNRERNLGTKTTTLEFLGIIIPFLLIPKQVLCRHVIVKVDNSACYYGWLNKNTPNDELASVLIRALHMISAFLECTVHIKHLPRNSNWEAQLVDRLSREETTTEWDRKLLRSFPDFQLPRKLLNWMRNPVEDWDLPKYLLECVIHRINIEY
jgi:hypothetical protein